MPAAIVAAIPRTVNSESLLHITQSPSVNKWVIIASHNSLYTGEFNPLKTKRRLLYLKTQSVPRRKHSPSLL